MTNHKYIDDANRVPRVPPRGAIAIIHFANKKRETRGCTAEKTAVTVHWRVIDLQIGGMEYLVARAFRGTWSRKSIRN